MSADTHLRLPESAPEKTHPGEGLAHWCASHLYDHQCVANPAVCIAFCGYDFKGVNVWADGTKPECIVCDEMMEARGDWDLPECTCDVCEGVRNV